MAPFAMITLMFALPSCSAFIKSPVPGVKNKVSTQFGLEYSTALIAIKVAIGKAIAEAQKLENDRYAAMSNADEHYVDDRLVFQVGNCTLTTTVITDVNDTAGITMAIPFSGLKDTLGTPGLSFGRQSVSKQIKKMDFSLDPDSVDPAKKTGALLNYEEIDALKNVRINNGLIDALQADIHAIHEAGSKKYGVMLQPRTLTYTLNLNVVRTGSGNISLSIVPTTPSIKNIAPKPQVTRTDTTTNELIVILSTSFPTPTAQSQPVQFFYEVHGDTGSAWIQSPYTQKELQKVIGKKFFALGPREKLTPKQVEQVNPFIDDKKRNDFNALMAPNGTNPPQVKDDNKNGKPPPPAGRGIPRSLLDPRSF